VPQSRSGGTTAVAEPAEAPARSPNTSGTPPITVFGIRHHGPGCARALRAALERLEPDLVLVEGPPDAALVVPLLADPTMRPPIALLIYRPDQPRHAAFYPFTNFSPEWQAMRYALERGRPTRFMDLPQAIQLARRSDGEAGDDQTTLPAAETDSAVPDLIPEAPPTDPVRDDPIGALAQAAGYSDRELWWEHQIEQRQDAAGLFEGILEAMSALRAAVTSPLPEEEAWREAHMRQTIRAARKEGFSRIAVICGAWHAPVLVDPGPGGPDAALLKGLPKVNVTATWVPWTNARLATRSGYGAGITSPGWYEHVWQHAGRAAGRWITHAARLMREAGLDASPASVIETVRLSETLAALRGQSQPGLIDIREAIQTVLCAGDPTPLALIRDRLEIGNELGEVPADAPTVPLAQDLAAQQRRLRLKPTADITKLDLDLREELGRNRGTLLHRLRMLGVQWGAPDSGMVRSTGTFHEFWKLQWQPELSIALVEACLWGTTIEAAAEARTERRAAEASDLPALTTLLDETVLAGLPTAVDYVLKRVGERAAVSSDLRHLMDALPPLARVARYGDVRGTRGEQMLPIIEGLFERIAAGLPASCASLDDDAAEAMAGSMAHVQETLDLLDLGNQKIEWRSVLQGLIARESVHGLVRGWACRLLLEARAMEEDELQRLAGLALSPAGPAPQAAAWVGGVLRGSGLLLLNQDGLWRALDAWLRALDPETFTATIPLLRRAFSGFEPPERRKMGEKVKHITAEGVTVQTATGVGGASDLDPQRVARVMPVLARILAGRNQ
jgi:hypothetical protein